jgi:predicted TIM-barrel fold metal-dependent hydrolase
MWLDHIQETDANMSYHPIWDAHVTLGEGTFSRLDLDSLLAQMDAAGVHLALAAPGDRWMAVDNREGNDTILAWVQRHPDRLCGYATVNPWYGRRAIDELTRALAAGLEAVKLHPARQGFGLLDEVAKPIWDFVAERRLPVYVTTGSAMSTPLQLAELARRYPEVPWIMGRSGRTDYGWLDFARATRQATNIYVETAHNAPGAIARMAEKLGAERILFASDLPTTILTMELSKLDDIDKPDRSLILGGNLARLLGKAVSSEETQSRTGN